MQELDEHTKVSNGNYSEYLTEQETFEKCWAHSPLQAAARPFTRCRYCRTPAIAIAQAACDVHNDDNDNDNV